MVSKTVEGTSKTVNTSRVRKIRIRKGRTDQVSSMGRNVTTFVITMDTQVTSNALLNYVLFETHHVSVVTSPI